MDDPTRVERPDEARCGHLPRLPAVVALGSPMLLAGSYVIDAADRQVDPVLLPDTSKVLGSRCLRRSPPAPSA